MRGLPVAIDGLDAPPTLGFAAEFGSIEHYAAFQAGAQRAM